jgi:hypothetical protein
MPRKTIDYSKTVIYKIVCNDLSITDVYVGHTTGFIRRKSEHKKDAVSKLYKLYETIRQNGGWSNYSMIEIEKFPCMDSNEARARERYWYEELNANLNSVKPISYKQEFIEYQKEYYEINKDKIIKYQKEYYEINKDKMNEKHKVYLQNNKDKINKMNKDYNKKNKEHKKEYDEKYYEHNKDKIKEHSKEYRQNNKDKIKIYNETNKNKRKEYREKNKDKINEKKRLKYLEKKQQK